ncbi:MAG: hypothetical protein J7647_14210 [Cyanobacteria bacterium SBLK]|nr:hypothetical protein [Cyanobacteria bacterium SBLK]
MARSYFRGWERSQLLIFLANAIAFVKLTFYLFLQFFEGLRLDLFCLGCGDRFEETTGICWRSQKVDGFNQTT